MVRSAGSSPLRRPSNSRGGAKSSSSSSSRSAKARKFEEEDDLTDSTFDGPQERSSRSDYESEESSISGKRLRVTANPSFNNVVAGFYNQLPEALRNMLPLGEEEGTNENADGSPPPDRRGAT